MGTIINILDNSGMTIAEKNAAVERAMTAVGLQAEGYAKLLSPVDTGRLRSSISSTAEGDTAAVGTNVEYAP